MNFELDKTRILTPCATKESWSFDSAILGQVLPVVWVTLQIEIQF